MLRSFLRLSHKVLPDPSQRRDSLLDNEYRQWIQRGHSTRSGKLRKAWTELNQYLPSLQHMHDTTPVHWLCTCQLRTQHMEC